MCINGEYWNIILNDDMKSPLDWTYPGSSSAKLSHDFCHLDTEDSDDVYTNFLVCGNGWPADLALLRHRVLSGGSMDLG